MPKKPKHDIDDDPMFDVSESAISNAIDRRLVQFFERVERLEEEKKGISDDIKDVWLEAKSTGYDIPIAKMVFKLRKMDKDDRSHMEAMIETYKIASGLA